VLLGRGRCVGGVGGVGRYTQGFKASRPPFLLFFRETDDRFDDVCVREGQGR
jgi:hypothetical protein